MPRGKQRQQEAVEPDEGGMGDGFDNFLDGDSDFEGGDDDHEFSKHMKSQEEQRQKQIKLYEQKLTEAKKKSKETAKTNVEQFKNLVNSRMEKQLEQWNARITGIKTSFETRKSTIVSVVSSLLDISETAESPPLRTSNPLYMHQQKLFTDSEKLTATAKSLLNRMQELQRDAQELKVCDLDTEKAHAHVDQLHEAAKDKIYQIVTAKAGDNHHDPDEEEGVTTVGWYEAARVVQDNVGGALAGMPELRCGDMDVD